MTKDETLYRKMSRWMECTEQIERKNSLGNIESVIQVKSVGYIFEESHDVRNENGELEQVEQLYIAFPEGRVHFVDVLSKVQPVKMMSFDSIIQGLKEFKGHYCDDHEYQFNIKTHAYSWPKLVEDYPDDTPKWDFINERMHDELNCYMGQMPHSDYGLQQDFSWITNWNTDGRSGGYLILGQQDHLGWEEVQVNKEDFEGEIADDNDPEYYQSELEELQRRAMERLLDLQWIEKNIELTIDGIEDWFKTEECWETFWLYGNQEDWYQERMEEKELVAV